MTTSSLAHRYALALYEESLVTKGRPAFLKDFQYVQQMLASQEDVAFFVQSALLDENQRLSIWQRISKGYHTLLVRFVYVLIQEGRIAHLEAIAASFYAMEEQRQGIHTATVSSAQPIALAERKKVTTQVAKMLHLKPSKMKIQWQVEKSLMGGLSLRYGNTLWDASLRRQVQVYSDVLKV